MQGEEAADQQSAADGQQGGKGDLRHHQPTAQPLARDAGGGALSALLERGKGRAAPQVEEGREAEEQPGEQRQRQREEQYPQIDDRAGDARHAVAGDRDDRRQAPEGQQEARRAAEAGEQQALAEELADQLPPAGAEGGADRDLALPRLGTGEEEVGHVGAGDQQHRGPPLPRAA